MMRHNAIAALASLATLVSFTGLAGLAACSADATAPYVPAVLVSNPAAARLDTARGLIATRSADENDADVGAAVYLVAASGDSLRLIGPVADILATMPGVEFWVEGALNRDGTMDVVDYAYRGADAMGTCPEAGKSCRIGETSLRPRGRKP